MTKSYQRAAGKRTNNGNLPEYLQYALNIVIEFTLAAN
jgi:hypothetical protein